MVMNYGAEFNTRKTSQRQPILGKKMSKNNAGGYSFVANKWDRFMRFLMLGSEGGTYYVGQSKLTRDNAKSVVKCIQEDGLRVVRVLKEVSTSGRAAKQGPTLFALALAATVGNEATKKASYDAIKDICRTGTMLFEFTGYIQDLRKWSAGLRKGISKFYTGKDMHKLDLQLVKYRQRNGWTHRDVMRLAHPKTNESQRNQMLGYAVGKNDPVKGSLCDIYEVLKNVENDGKKSVDLVVDAIKRTGLPREGVPTHFLKEPNVWLALLEKMPIGALVRNLGNISAAGLTNSNVSEATKLITKKLGDQEAISRSRIHPMAILLAMKTYSSGRGFKGSNSWNVNGKIVDALDKAFYMAFGNVEKTGLTFMHALDVSQSMTTSCLGSEQISCRDASAALALINMSVEDNYEVIGFTSGGTGKHFQTTGNRGWGYGRGVTKLSLSPKQRLDDAIRSISRLPFGGTDCALPMEYARVNKIPVDVFIVYTDSETWAGDIHPKQALDKYRKEMGIPAKMIVMGMASNKFTIADPDDSGMLDLAGFDAAMPNLINEFVKGY